MASSSDPWVKEYNEAVKIADDINGMISERSSFPASGPDTLRHASAIRRKITILGTRLDGLQSLLSRPVGKPLQSSSSPQRLSEKETKHDRSACQGMSSMMLGCLWSKETEERQLQRKERQQKEQLTLEDWLIASPGILQKNNGTTTGGEYHVFKHSSKRVFPSFVGEMANSSSSKPRVSFSKERPLKSEDGEREDMEVSWSRSQSGKSKKKVSFRLPEEADIFIFHSSSGQEESGEKEI